MVETFRARRHTATSGALLHLTASAKFRPRASASRNIGCFLIPPALWMIARENSPLDFDDTKWKNTLDPPAEWPKIVTLAGSPSKAEIFFLTQSSAAC